jgi:putative ABC transport system substrate-binding protein
MNAVRHHRTGAGKGIFCFALSAAFLLLCIPTEAQQPAKIPLVGFLTGGGNDSARNQAFRQGLRALGYIEGKNIVIEWRAAERKPGRLLVLATELVGLKVDVIVVTGLGDLQAAKQATATIPIVMVVDSDPVRSGFVASLARPDGNITGLSTLAPELSGKRLELLKEIVPRFSRVAAFGTSTSAANAQELTEIELAAGAFKVNLQYLDVLGPKDFEMRSEPRARKGPTQPL